MNTCPWCGKPTEKRVLELKDYFLSKEEFSLMECPACGLRFTNPRPSQEVIGKYYQSENYYSHQQNKIGFVPRIYEFVKSFNIKHKASLAVKGLPKGRLLDIGCGVGDFLVYVQKLGWEVHGIEPSDDAKAIAESRLGFRPQSPKDYASLPDHSFDVITLWHVLEHIDDLHFQTSEIIRLLKPGGRLVIALPNFQSFDCQYYKEKWAAWDVPRHLNHFAPDVLRRMWTSLGFENIDTQKLIWDAYYISYMSERFLGHGFPLLRGAWVGLRSNCKARRNGMYSSLVYRFQKP
jgi:2-polyprenyl-3-methyl-5-hydroxy-6-metoxy-1,4-benzoquinol methylase